MRRARTEQTGHDQDGPSSGMLTRELLRFFVLSLVAALLLGIAAMTVGERIARERALEDARLQGSDIAARLVAPLVDAEVRAGDAGAAVALTRVMRNRMGDGSIRHVKIWSEDGRILWADQAEIVGREFELESDVRSLFGSTGATAEVSDLSEDENVAERDEGEMVEVYAGAFDADGEPVVFEAYLPTSAMEANAHAIVVSFVPLIVAALVLFLVVVMPLAVSLSRRVERGERDRIRLMRHAALATDLERRRLARDLHDGVVQDLAGLGYTLPMVERQLRPDGDFATATATLQRATTIVQGNVQALRQLMTDLYPPDLDGPGLREAIQQLVRSEAHSAGLRPEVYIDEGLELPSPAAGLAFRVLREAVHNVVKHADATTVLVELGVKQGQVMIRVVDDGAGAVGEGALRAPTGHLGLRLLHDTLKDAGGDLAVTSPGVGRGVTVVARFPVALRGG